MTPQAASLILFGGMFGIFGVAAAAMASHGAETRNLAAISTICLAHGPALLALGLAGRGRLMAVAGWILTTGTVLFCLDLGLRQWVGQGAFAGAAPLAGLAMIAGWATVTFASALAIKKESTRLKGDRNLS